MSSNTDPALDCPDREAFEALLRGTATDALQRQIEEHLGACGKCQSFLEELSGSRAFEGTSLGAIEDYSNPHVEKLAEIFKTQGRFVLDDSDLVAAEALQFLTPLPTAASLGELGSYEIIEEVARGGMGVVLKAFDPHLERTVAIKVLAPALVGNSEAYERFMCEARAVAALDHDNILPIHAVEPEKPLPYLVVPFVDGSSLQQWIDERGPLNNEQLVAISSKIASGLGEAHRAGIIHRDLKPANILLEEDLARVWITDFGLAHMGEDQGITQTASLSGTPQFMAPEQVDGGKVDHRADLYGLGATLYVMATGKPPFQGESMAATLHQVINDAPVAPKEVVPELHPGLNKIITCLLEKSPSDRFQSAAEVILKLEDLDKVEREDRVSVWKRLALAACLLVAGLICWARWPANEPTFHIVSQGMTFETIAAAMGEAEEGDVIEVRGDGEILMEPLVLGDRTLTVRAGEGSSPVFTGILSDEALFSTNRRLWLEGLTFQLKHTNASKATRFLTVDTGTLCMNNCRLLVEPPDEKVSVASACILARNLKNIEIKNCEIRAPSLTLIEHVTTESTAQQRVQLTNNAFLLQRCLSFSSLTLSTCNIDLRQNILLAETFAESHPDHGDLQFRVYAQGNLLGLDQALFHLPAATDVVRMTWDGVENTYAIGRWYVHGFLKRGNAMRD